MRNGALITQFPGVTWFVDCTIPGISEILVARRHHAERSIGALICPTTGGKFLSPANPLAIRMLGQFLSVEIQASARSGKMEAVRCPGWMCGRWLFWSSPTDLACRLEGQPLDMNY